MCNGTAINSCEIFFNMDWSDRDGIVRVSALQSWRQPRWTCFFLYCLEEKVTFSSLQKGVMQASRDYGEAKRLLVETGGKSWMYSQVHIQILKKRFSFIENLTWLGRKRVLLDSPHLVLAPERTGQHRRLLWLAVREAPASENQGQGLCMFINCFLLFHVLSFSTPFLSPLPTKSIFKGLLLFIYYSLVGVPGTG